MCMSFKCLFSIMNVKNRRFSLDSYVDSTLDGQFSGKKCSGRFGQKKSRHHIISDAQPVNQDLHQGLHNNTSYRHTIAEEPLEQSDEVISRSSQKQNKSFHKLFQEIPEEENLTHTFVCALQKELLYYGKLFVSENHVCFHSSVLLKDTKVVIPASSVREVKKHKSALSMLSIQTVDGEKYSFVSLRHREMCYELLQTIFSHAQGMSGPHHSSAEDQADPDVASSQSSLEDIFERDVSRQGSIDHGSSHVSTESPVGSGSTHQSIVTDENESALSWIWRVIERVSSILLLRQITDVSVFVYFSMMLMVFLLLVSGYIGQRMIALEKQLNSLGDLTEFSANYREYQEP